MNIINVNDFLWWMEPFLYVFAPSGAKTWLPRSQNSPLAILPKALSLQTIITFINYETGNGFYLQCFFVFVKGLLVVLAATECPFHPLVVWLVNQFLRLKSSSAVTTCLTEMSPLSQIPAVYLKWVAKLEAGTK